MTNQYLFKLIPPLALAAALAACGGSDGDSGNTPAPQPPIVQAPFKLEHLIGSTETDLQVCPYDSWLRDKTRFSHLMRARATDNKLYLLDSGEACKAIHSDGHIYPVEYNSVDNVRPSHYSRPLLIQIPDPDGYSSIDLNPIASFMGGPFGPEVRFPNSMFFPSSPRHPLVLNHVAASSELGYELSPTDLARYAASRNGWETHSPGLFHFDRPQNSWGLFVAGTPGQPPGYADGKGREARFTAPHDLEGDADGLLYLIDAGRIRTVDQKDWQVRTLDNPSLGASGVFKTLDSDRMGRVHAIEQINSGRYVWHRLADKRRVPFTLPQPPAGKTVETFAVIGDELLMAVRGMTAEAGKNASTVYRVNASGQMLRVSGQAQPAQADDWLNDPQKFAWPQVQHLEYGSDGHLYVALPQGVVRAKDFK